MEEVKPVTAVQVDYKCTECDGAYMRPTGIVLMSRPPKHPHKCNACGHEETFLKQYPYIDYQ